jgi:hypothetical protein
VTLSRAGQRTLRTDGNGWFGAVGLEPGEARVTATWSGERWVGLARVTAGDVAEPRWWRAGDDDDGDGVGNEEELLCGTDPGVAADRPRWGVAMAGARLRLTLPTAPGGREFVVWSADTIGPGAAWREVRRVATSPGMRGVDLDVDVSPGSGAAGFFRVEARWGP